MAQYLPAFRPGDTVTFDVTAAVTGGRIVELGTAEINLKQLEANAGIAVRNSREKCTEGLVASMVDADANVCDARKGVERLQARMNAIRLAVDNLHDTRRMFVAWMAMQKQAGVTD